MSFTSTGAPRWVKRWSPVITDWMGIYLNEYRNFQNEDEPMKFKRVSMIAVHGFLFQV